MGVNIWFSVLSVLCQNAVSALRNFVVYVAVTVTYNNNKQ